jgi:hypothetical protein
MKLTRFQLEDFRVIRDLEPESFEALLDRLRQLDRVPVAPDKLADAVAGALPGNQGAAESIVREALTIHGWIRQGGLTIAEVQDRIREAIKADSGWTDEELGRWRRAEAAFGDLLSLSILRLVASAYELSYEYTNLWRGARTFTDIRPIYDDEATAIEGAVVSYTFRLRFEAVV